MTSPPALPAEISQRLRGLSHLIGNTPMLAIDCTYRGRPRTIYAKAEHLNLTGSIKDRMALHILRNAYASGSLRPGHRIAEATSGNTGISLAAVGRAMGHPVVIFMPDWLSRERLDLIRSLGATVQLVSREEGGFQGSMWRRIGRPPAPRSGGSCGIKASNPMRSWPGSAPAGP
jgi:cysteine synthase A